MASIIACCRDALVVASWLSTWLPVTNQPAMRPSGGSAAEVLWHVTGEARGTPALFGRTAFFLSRRHELLAIQVESGRVIWRRNTHGPGSTTAGTAVVVTPTSVVAGDGGLVAFTHTGIERWRFNPADGGNLGTYLGENAGDVLVAGSSAGRLWAVDTESGDVRWSLDLSPRRQFIVFAPVVSQGTVFAAFTAPDELRTGGLVAVDLATGRERWRRRLAFAGGPLPAGTIVLAAGQDGSIHAFDRHSGASRWLIPSASSTPWNGPDFRPLALSGRLLIAGSLTGGVTAYDLATRRERWRSAPMAASIVFGIAADAHAVYVPYLAGRLIALEADRGDERWLTSPDAFGFSWKPLIAAGRLLAASSNAGFFAFRL
jgi:outer membrane protein assembly factor BamB